MPIWRGIKRFRNSTTTPPANRQKVRLTIFTFFKLIQSTWFLFFLFSAKKKRKLRGEAIKQRSRKTFAQLLEEEEVNIQFLYVFRHFTWFLSRRIGLTVRIILRHRRRLVNYRNAISAAYAVSSPSIRVSSAGLVIVRWNVSPPIRIQGK